MFQTRILQEVEIADGPIYAHDSASPAEDPRLEL
jgi:hypothetical protein